MLPAITALAGVLVAGVIAETRTHLQGQREHRQALRRLLYQLLELRHRIKRESPQTLLPFLRTYVSRRLGPLAADQLDSPGARDLTRRLVKSLAEGASAFSSATSYGEAVDTVASVDPFLAYQIGGLGNLADLDSRVAQYYDSLMALPEIATDPQSSDIRRAVELGTLDTLYPTSLAELGEAVRTVAKCLGPISWLRAHLALRNQDALPSEAVQLEMDRLFDQLVPPGAS